MPILNKGIDGSHVCIRQLVYMQLRYFSEFVSKHINENLTMILSKHAM